MSDLASIALGGLTLRLHSDRKVTLRGLSADYTAFRQTSQTPGNGDDVVNLYLDPDNMPPVDGMLALLETGSSWSVYTEGGNHRMVMLKPPLTPTPLWQMLIERGSSEVVVYCGENFVRRVGGRVEIVNPVCYPLDLILMMYELATRNGVIVHSTGIELKGRGFLFPGVSGAGKSTLTRLFQNNGHAVRLSDDRIIVRELGDGPRMFGTPWLGEAGVCAAGNAPLTAILFLRQSRTNSITQLSGKQAIEKLLPVVSVPWYDKDVLAPIMATCEAIVSKVPVYDFGFTPTDDAVAFLEKIQIA